MADASRVRENEALEASILQFLKTELTWLQVVISVKRSVDFFFEKHIIGIGRSSL